MSRHTSAGRSVAVHREPWKSVTGQRPIVKTQWDFINTMMYSRGNQLAERGRPSPTDERPSYF